MNKSFYFDPRYINIAMCKKAMKYWEDAHNTNLSLARVRPQDKVEFLAKAQQCRKHYQDLLWLMFIARTKTLH